LLVTSLRSRLRSCRPSHPAHVWPPELTSRDHSATSMFIHTRRLQVYQGPVAYQLPASYPCPPTNTGLGAAPCLYYVRHGAYHDVCIGGLRYLVRGPDHEGCRPFTTLIPALICRQIINPITPPQSESLFFSKESGVPYYERSAHALRDATRKLRRKRGITPERWVNFVHYGARLCFRFGLPCLFLDPFMW